MVSRQAEITRGRMLTLFVLVVVGIWALAASNVKAALQPGCTQSGTTVTCSYPQQGQQASFVVPAGVTSVGVYAVGGTGGTPVLLVRHNAAGPGAIVAGGLNVSPGSVLSIQVAGAGTSTGPGAGGGGPGCAGGGGASRVSTSGGPLVVAGGGGGDGCYGPGGANDSFSNSGGGGKAGANGSGPPFGTAGGGMAGTSTAGGAGGAGGTGIVNGNPGAAGFASAGGAGGSGASGAGASGGGGGGGLYGGGGGGQGETAIVNGSPTARPGGGGGGGSSLVPPGGTLQFVTVGAPAEPNPSPMVVISYTAPPSAGTPAPGTILPPGSTGSSTVPQGAARVRLTGVSQSHARWRRGNKLPKFAAIARVRKPPVGTTFRFKLSGPASVRFAFTQSRPGRRVGGRCVAQTARNRSKRRCPRTVTAGSFRFSAGSGAYSVRFQGRISRSKKLKPGRYTLIITATNTAGSSSARLRFTIVG